MVKPNQFLFFKATTIMSKSTGIPHAATTEIPSKAAKISSLSSESEEQKVFGQISVEDNSIFADELEEGNSTH